MAGRHGRHVRARAGGSAGNQRRQRGDGLSRGYRGDALGANAARLGRGRPRRSPSRPLLPPTMTIISWPCAPTPISTCTSSMASGPSPPARDRRPQRWPTSSFAACRSRGCVASRRCAGTRVLSRPYPKAGCASCRQMRLSRRRAPGIACWQVEAGGLARRHRPRFSAARSGRDARERTGRRGEIGEAFLKGRALTIWRKALLAGPAASIDATLETLKQDDGLEACVSVAWMPASALAASPRRFVRLLGLNSSRWPRGIAEDRLIPDHIIPTPVLDPLPVSLADRRDFETIIATTTGEVVLSRARRDSDGRLLGRSPLLARARRRNLPPPQRCAGACLQRNRPSHGPAAGLRRRSAGGQRARLLARLAACRDHGS